MQYNSHHRYQNSFILCGAVCGLLIGVLTGCQEAILVDALTAYLPASIITAQLLSFVLHTVLSSLQNPDLFEHENSDRAANFGCEKYSIRG
jgi:hypothetical protein